MSPRCAIRQARVSDAAAIARVQVDTWKSAYKGLVSQNHLDRMSHAGRTTVWAEMLEQNGPETPTYVAVSNNTCVGFVGAGPNRDDKCIYEGEMYALYVLPEHQGCGLGASLFDAGFKHVRRCGLKGMAVWVLEGNPAQGFYERKGGARFGAKTITIGGEELPEIGYGWQTR